MVVKPQEIEDEEHEQVLERVAAVDVAEASGMVCLRVPHPDRAGRRRTLVWMVPATTGGVLELAGQLAVEGVEKVTLESTAGYWRIWYYLLEAAGLDVQLVRAYDVKQALHLQLSVIRVRLPWLSSGAAADGRCAGRACRSAVGGALVWPVECGDPPAGGPTQVVIGRAGRAGLRCSGGCGHGRAPNGIEGWVVLVTRTRPVPGWLPGQALAPGRVAGPGPGGKQGWSCRDDDLAGCVLSLGKTPSLAAGLAGLAGCEGRGGRPGPAAPPLVA